MKFKVSNLLWGLAFILVGVLLYCKAFLDIDISIWNIFFRIWPIAIIVPNLISLFTKDRKMGNIFGLIIGIILILLANDIISGAVLKKIIFPLIFIFIGISIIFKGAFNNSHKNTPINNGFTSQDFSNPNIGSFKKPEYAAIFSSSANRISNESFYGCELTSVFGSLVLDLREAIISEDIVIDANVIFAGADILVPSNVNVKVSSVPIFGGVSNKTLNQNIEGPTIFINAVCMFGGLDIK